jgi:hypothetical protein
MFNNTLAVAGNIHTLDIENSKLELANGFSFHIPLGTGDIGELVDFITEVSIKKGVIDKNDKIVCFYA